jgi:hypothetical protein
MNRNPISQEIRARVVKWDCIRSKSAHEREVRLKRQPAEREKSLPTIHWTKD